MLLWVLWTGIWFSSILGQRLPQMWQIMVDDFFHHLVMAGGFLYVAVCGSRKRGAAATFATALNRVSASGAIWPSP